jgi:hypothetical protein
VVRGLVFIVVAGANLRVWSPALPEERVTYDCLCEMKMVMGAG